ncbi:MAG: (deoxy)nucleoside triphosphate pyrophosphohydrolase [Acidobacteriaceae bacterium]|nr:(deoxy)nucleoside triphosphate pyrophosphohydrolase [Acidobacteriaceae bacterium]
MRNRPLLVAAGIICRDRHVLVAQRREIDRHPLKWEFPGGKVELGESPQQALIRELREELQIDALIDGELARYEHEYPSGGCVHLLFFAVTQFAGEPEARVFKQICWTSIHDLPTLDFLEGDLNFVRRLARGDFEQQLEVQRRSI